MKLDQSPPRQNLQRILQALKVKSIEELVSNQQLQIQIIARTTNHHKLIVHQYLASIQQAITKPYSSQQKITINLGSIFKRWAALSNQASDDDREEAKWNINSSSLVEIIGRSNGGKSYFLNEIIIECLKAKQKVVYLDSNQNYQKLSFRLGQQLEQNSELDAKDLWLRHFHFKTLSQLSMLLHCIGNQLNTSMDPYFIFIDSLARSQQPQAQNSHAASSFEFKFVDKFKRLLIETSQKVGGVVYASRCSNSNPLFNQAYKSDKHRPKWVGSTPKQWDSIADKTFCVDYSRTGQDRQYWRLISTKSIACKPLHFTRIPK